MTILAKAEKAGQYRVALQGIREARGCLELLAELEGRLSRQPTFNVLLSPEWLEIQTTMLRTLDAFPDARVAVAESLAQLESGHVDG